MSWLLAPAVGLALEPGPGARSRISGGAACASGDGAAVSAGARGTCPRLSGNFQARTLPMVIFLIIPPAMLGVSVT
eukprot:2923878-Pyramimonas_sp.AAC.1